MEILLALIYGAAIGTAAHFTVDRRSTRGAALGPMLGAFLGGAVWMSLTWAGQTPESPWLWLASALAPVIVVFPTLLMLGRLRDAHDERERVRLNIG
jgi:uncharacterized membrane protein YeaQ/YmgE (transglycosylase-associated protein family)